MSKDMLQIKVSNLMIYGKEMRMRNPSKIKRLQRDLFQLRQAKKTRELQI